MRYALALLLAALLLSGCSGPEPPEKNATDAVIPQQPDVPLDNASSAPPPEAPAVPGDVREPEASSSPPAESGDGLLLFGRSVSAGWADYMGLGWDDDGTMSGTYGGYAIRRYEVESPPGIVSSAKSGMDQFGSDVVFFKLCFVDFSQEAGETLADDEGYVQEMYEEAVVKRGRKLIVGNALPQVPADTTEGLKSNHRAYNAWLGDFASTHKDVYVLDLYGMLVAPDGALRPEYAVSSSDSHLNDKGYSKITPALMDLLARIESD